MFVKCVLYLTCSAQHLMAKLSHQSGLQVSVSSWSLIRLIATVLSLFNVRIVVARIREINISLVARESHLQWVQSGGFQLTAVGANHCSAPMISAAFG